MTSQRIAIVTQDPANRGGVLRLVQYMYERIRAIGCEPWVLHYASNRFWPELSASVASAVRGRLTPSYKDYEFEGMSCRAIGTTLPEWEPNRIASNPVWQQSLEACSAAVLVTGSAHTGFALTESSVPYLAWVSSTVDDDRRERLRTDRSLSAYLEKLSLPAIRQAERAVLKKASRVLAVSDDARRALLEIARRDIETAPYPVDAKFWSPDESVAKERSILFVGRANDPRKDIRLFFTAASLIDADVKLDIVSSVMPCELLDEFALLQPRMRVHKGIDELKLRELYRKSSALVVTSEQEGLGIAVMEAMSCGTPVISTRCGGPEMLIEDGASGYLTDRDAKEIRVRVESVISSTDLARGLGAHARERMQRSFSREIWDARFDSEITRLLLHS